jgi:signal transduction histidine kinase
VRTTVLIVDDHDGFRESARALLEAEGFAVVGGAADGAAALAAAQRLRPEVVLLDIQLPDLDGFAVARQLAAANARLQAEARARLAEIGASRRRILEAGDEERSRLERRLRDGALRQLDEVAETLRAARRPAAGGADERLARAEIQLARTQEELRRLARGIHPRELSERGLAAALASLARDVPLPVKLAISAAGESPAAAACAYFVCAEALANVAKYAAASKVAVTVRSDPGGTTVEIEDDGVGGADPDRGRGCGAWPTVSRPSGGRSP